MSVHVVRKVFQTDANLCPREVGDYDFGCQQDYCPSGRFSQHRKSPNSVIG